MFGILEPTFIIIIKKEKENNFIPKICG